VTKPDSVDTLAAVSGLARTDILQIWEVVKINHAMLDKCPRHSFEPAAPGVRKRKCLSCGGELGCIEARWYETGLRHAEART
jgi:hypothetical protein